MDVIDLDELPDLVVDRNLSDMDIGEDLASPSENIKLYDDGKYLFKTSTGEFDIDRFNRYYEQYRERRKKEMYKRMKDRLDILNKVPPIIPIYDYSVGQILIGMKDSVFGVIDDLLKWEFVAKSTISYEEGDVDTKVEIDEINVSTNILTKDNRMFYLGLLFVIISLILYLIMILLSSVDKEHVTTQTNNCGGCCSHNN